MNEDAYVMMAQGIKESQNKKWYSLSPQMHFAGIAIASSIPLESTGDEVAERLIELYEEVKRRKSVSGKFPHTYVNNRENPSFIKLYDPVKCGGSCSKTAPHPWWIFSTIKPTESEISEILQKRK